MGFGQYRRRFLAYLNKDDFNEIRGPIDPLEYYSMFVTWASLFSVMPCEEMSIWMYVSPLGSGIFASTGTVLFLITFVHYVPRFDINVLTESGTYLLLMVYQLLITISVVRGRKQYHNLLEALKDDFHYISTKGKKYREKFFENQRFTFKASILMIILTAITGGGMFISGCIAVGVTLSRQEYSAEKPLPFPFWIFDFDLHASPVYEILFLVSMTGTLFYTYIYAFMAQSHVIWIREITCRADIITWNLHDLLADVFPPNNNEEKEYYATLIKQRMREIIEMHNSMYRLIDDYAAVYKKCLLFEQTVSSPIICMTAFCFVEKYEAGEIQLILLLLCFGTTAVVFTPNYLCTHLLEKIESVGDACWDMPFWNAGPVIRPYLVLIMQRSMRPLPLAACGFAEISLKTYSASMTRAYSCFNMLRQGDFNFSE